MPAPRSPKRACRWLKSPAHVIPDRSYGRIWVKGGRGRRHYWERRVAALPGLPARRCDVQRAAVAPPTIPFPVFPSILLGAPGLTSSGPIPSEVGRKMGLGQQWLRARWPHLTRGENGRRRGGGGENEGKGRRGWNAMPRHERNRDSCRRGRGQKRRNRHQEAAPSRPWEEGEEPFPP